MSTLEDVFINVSKLTKKKSKIKNGANEIIIDEEEKKEQEKREENYKILYDDNNYNEKYSYFSKIYRDTKVSIKKRLVQIYRDKKTFFLEILCPILLALIGCAVCSLDILEKNKVIPLLLNQITNDTQIIHYYSNPSIDASEINKIIYDYSSEDISDIEFNNIDVPSSPSSKIRLTINFMNELFETEKNYDKKSYADYIFYSIDNSQHKYELINFVDLLSRQNDPHIF